MFDFLLDELMAFRGSEIGCYVIHGCGGIENTRLLGELAIPVCVVVYDGCDCAVCKE